VVARKGTAQYAFHRGKNYLGQRVPQSAAPNQPPGAAGDAAGGQGLPALNQSLEFNIQLQNSSNRLQNIERLERRYSPAKPSQGVQIDQAR